MAKLWGSSFIIAVIVLHFFSELQLLIKSFTTLIDFTGNRKIRKTIIQVGMKQKGMTYDHDFGYLILFFSSLLKKEAREKENEVAKIVMKSHTFLFHPSWVALIYRGVIIPSWNTDFLAMDNFNSRLSRPMSIVHSMSQNLFYPQKS